MEIHAQRVYDEIGSAELCTLRHRVIITVLSWCAHIVRVVRDIFFYDLSTSRKRNTRPDEHNTILLYDITNTR